MVSAVDDAALIAIVSALFGGAGIKVIDAVIGRASKRDDLATQLRDELRQEVGTLREQITGLDSSVDTWKTRYYAIQAAFNELSAAAIAAGLVEDVREIREKYSDSD